MTRAVRVVGAALGLLLLAAPLGFGPVRAQDDDFVVPDECGDPPPVQDEMSVTILSPTGGDAKTAPTVAVDATFTNDNDHPVFGQRGAVREMRAFVLPCAAGQVVPTAPEPVVPAGDQRSATLSWSADFETNGRYAVVFEGKGEAPGDSDGQSVRDVQLLTLAVPASKPTNVKVSDPTNGVVNVTWDYTDPEPDLFGFEIRRARQGSGDYATIKNGAVGPKLRTVSDTPPVGAWRYQVVAYRQGAPEGSISRDDTVEVAEPAPAADSTGGTSGGTGSSTGGGTGGADGTEDGSSTTIGGSTPGSPSNPRASVNLQDFAASLNARRTSPTARIEPPDPGFQELLPFDAPGELEVDEEPQELGGDEPNVGFGQEPIADPGERRRSLGFVAFGLLLFVLSMTGLFVKSEVKRADLLDLDAVDAVDDDDDARPVSVEDAAPVAAAAAVATRVPRRRRAPVEALAEEPVVPAAVARRPRARRAPVDPTVEAPLADVVAPAPVNADASRRSRRPRVPTPAPAAPATMAIPEARRRWSGRPSDAPEVEPTAHGFDDLVDGGAAITAAARRRSARAAEEAPIDAPGLDVPDPPPTRTTTRPRPSRAATAPLPTRRPAAKKKTTTTKAPAARR